jgi:hypothetical protein
MLVIESRPSLTSFSLYLLQSIATAMACCNFNYGIGSFVNGDCEYIDVCNPVPAETPKPTPYPTPNPTPYPTANPVTSAPSNPPDIETSEPTYFPTVASTPGSTPTVSKETTGPPTLLTARPRSTYNTDETVECREITGGHPVVCVKVCTTIKSVYNGSTLVDESATTTESECD